MYTNIVQTDRKRHWANDSEDSLPSWPWFTCLSLSIYFKTKKYQSCFICTIKPRLSTLIPVTVLTFSCYYTALCYVWSTCFPLCWQWYWHCIFRDMLLLFGDQATNS